MRRFLFFAYGLFSYLLAAFAVLCFGLFLLKPFAISPPEFSWNAVAVDVALIALFAVQHSLMARPAFKRLSTRIIPQPIERSTYVLASSLTLIVLMTIWKPIGPFIWDVHNSFGRVAIYFFFALGAFIAVGTTLLIDHFDLMGLRQVQRHLQGEPYTAPRFATPGPYRYVRHPLYFGLLLLLWSTPTMIVSNLLLAGALTLYILVAVRWEERDLVAAFGDEYRDYQRQVPQLIPGSRGFNRHIAARRGTP